MATIHQIQANQSNATHSTGPRTGAGKQRAAANAIRHGFTGRTLVVHDDEREEFQSMLAEWEQSLRPSGPLEKELFGQLLHSSWNLRRLSRAEAALIDDSCTDPLLSETAQPRLRSYSIYQARHERAFHKALAELRRLQEERLLRETVLPRDAEPLPALPRSAAVRQAIRRERKAHEADRWSRMKQYQDAPMPGSAPAGRPEQTNPITAEERR